MLTIGCCCWAPLFLGFAGGFCQDAGLPADALPVRTSAPPAANPDEVKVILKEEDMTITDKPRTVDIPLNETIRPQIAEALARYPDATVRLSIRGVHPPVNREAINGFNLFLNKPNANAATSEKDPHFVGATEFSPTAENTPQGFNVDLLRTLVKLHRRGQFDLEKPLKITIVPIPAPGVSRIPDEASFAVRELTLTVPTRSRSRKPA